MRKSTLLGYTKATFAAFALIALTQSCQKPSELQAPDAPVSEEHLAALKQSISAATGAAVSQIDYSAVTKTFTVTKDAKLSLADAEGYFQKQPTQGAQNSQGTQQRVNTYTVSSTRVRNITVYCDGTVPSDWVAIMDQAIANWNATGSAIHLSRVTSQYITSTSTSTTTTKGRKRTTSTTTTTSADVLVNSFNDATTSTIAQAYYPSSTGAPGNQVNINLYYTYLSDSYKVFALTHELGHIVGFTHTDQTYGSLINGTPVTDPSSVMNSVCLSWAGFTNYDVTAFKTIYPY